ncbi:MAG: oligosaccharide flippase family protein [Clostridia bacterium]|nr:oligosaccharide flippase family protein [Clostridia bacterium]
MNLKTNLMKNTLIMTATNLLMRSVAVSFNAYLTSRIGSAGIGLFQLIMTVYSMAVTFSCAGIKLASTRVTVEINANRQNDLNKSMRMFDLYALMCGAIICAVMYILSDFIGEIWISDSRSAPSLRILALSLPFVAMSASLSGYFTASNLITHYSFIQLIEQGVKIAAAVIILNSIRNFNVTTACMAIVASMTASEAISFTLSFILKKTKIPARTNKLTIKFKRLLRIAIPDAAGTCARSILLTVEHLLIPKGFEKSGTGSKAALSAYGNIHAMALPILLYPCAILTSFSALLIPELAAKNERNDRKAISRSVEKNLKRTFVYSVSSAVILALFAPVISDLIYKSNEAVQYIRILAPLVPIMYMDTITDGMLKGLDQQIQSMRYNIIDSALCVVMVWFLLPVYSVKGYIFILYASELINFYLSIGRLIKICDIRIPSLFRFFSEPQEDIPTFLRRKRC